MKRDFKCETKPASRWHQVTVNKWVTATELNHLRLIHSGTKHIVMLLRDANSAVAVFGIIFVATEQKQAIWCLKRKSLHINLLFIELLYKINIT